MGRAGGRGQSPAGLLRVAQVGSDGKVDAGDSAPGPRDSGAAIRQARRASRIARPMIPVAPTTTAVPLSIRSA